MKKLLLAVFAFIYFLTFTTGLLAADNEPTNAELLKEIQQLKGIISGQGQRIAELEAKHRIEGYQFLDGFRVGAGATFIIQGSIDANNTAGRNEDVTDASYSVDLEFEKGFKDFGLAFLHLETGDGKGVEDELEVFSNVNRDANDVDNVVKIADVWYEHYLFDKQFTLAAGKLDPTLYVDQNAIAHNETTQFLGRTFRNSPTIDFPDNNAGIHTLIAPEKLPYLELEGQILDGDGDWEDIFDNIFATYQINLKPLFFNGLAGNYRIYGWYKDTPHTKWVEPDDRKDEDKYGFGASIDQKLMDIFTIFCRYGWCAPDVYEPNITSSTGANYSLEHSFSAGFQLNGKSWEREKDHLSCAIGWILSSDEYKKAGLDRKADDEVHMEAYYSCQINEHLTLSPDAHIIWNPFGNDHAIGGERRNDTIAIIGCRGQIDF